MVLFIMPVLAAQKCVKDHVELEAKIKCGTYALILMQDVSLPNEPVFSPNSQMPSQSKMRHFQCTGGILAPVLDSI